MKQSTREAINQALSLAASVHMPVRWRAGRLLSRAGGERKSKSRGSDGFDLIALTEYETSDEIRDIDWAASAQTGMQPILVAQKLVPREITVTIVVDVRQCMNFGTARTTKRLRAAELLASLIKSAGKSHDRVSVVLFSEQSVEAVIKPQAPKRALIPALVRTIEARSTAGNDAAKSGFVRALSHLPKRRSCVFLISDFSDFASEEKEALLRASQLHEVACMIVQDPRERELPKGAELFGMNWGGLYTLQDMTTGMRKTIWLSRGNRRRYADAFRRQHEDVVSYLSEIHTRWSVFSTDDDQGSINKLISFLYGLTLQEEH